MAALIHLLEKLHTAHYGKENSLKKSDENREENVVIDKEMDRTPSQQGSPQFRKHS